MPFTTDRDLLALQPTLFREVAWLAQTLHRGTLRIEAGELIAVTGAFPAAVAPGHVAVLDDRPLEIAAITSPTSLTVSLSRAAVDDPVIPPADTANLSGSIATFAPQIRIIHDQLLRMLGLAPSQQAIDPLAPTESAIVNPRDLWLVEALGTLHLIYTSASATLAPDSALAQRAAHYQQRFAEERWRARALLDLNNDGLADTTRALNTLHLAR
jgi:hypothetical protein